MHIFANATIFRNISSKKEITMRKNGQTSECKLIEALVNETEYNREKRKNKPQYLLCGKN